MTATPALDLARNRLCSLGAFALHSAADVRPCRHRPRREEAVRRLPGPRRRHARDPRGGDLRAARSERRREDHPHLNRGRTPARDRRGGAGARARRGDRLPLHPERPRARAAGDQLRPLLHRRGVAADPGWLLRCAPLRGASGRDPDGARPHLQAQGQHALPLRRHEAPAPHREGARARPEGALPRRAHRRGGRGASPGALALRAPVARARHDRRPDHPLPGGGGGARGPGGSHRLRAVARRRRQGRAHGAARREDPARHAGGARRGAPARAGRPRRAPRGGGQAIAVDAAPGASFGPALAAFALSGLRVQDVETRRMRLEDVFVGLLRGGADRAAAAALGEGP